MMEKWEEKLGVLVVLNFEKARELDPRNNSVIWNTAETYVRVGRYADAASVFEEGLAVNPDAHFFSLARAAIDLRTNGDGR